MTRPFRFGISVGAARTRREWADKVRRIEDLGFDLLVVADHVVGEGLAPKEAIAAAAQLSEWLRFGTLVLDNDFRHPAVVAKETATLDVLTDGRLEVGLGAGWDLADYEASGIPFRPGRERVDRLEDSVRIIKGLWVGPLTFSGEHYRVRDLEIDPKPVQDPHPPLLLGGGGPRLLSLAARLADIVALAPRAKPEGGLDAHDAAGAAAQAKVELVRAAAGARLDELEISTLLQTVRVTTERAKVAEDYGRRLDLGADDVLGSPFALIGTVEEIVDDLEARRRRWGISHVVAFEKDIDAFAEVVSRLRDR